MEGWVEEGVVSCLWKGGLRNGVGSCQWKGGLRNGVEFMHTTDIIVALIGQGTVNVLFLSLQFKQRNISIMYNANIDNS